MIVFKLPVILICMLLAFVSTVFKVTVITFFFCLFIWFEGSPSPGTNIYQDVSFAKDYNKLKGVFKSVYSWFLNEVKSI